MKFFWDMEFTGLHQKTTPISLGIVNEHGGTFYAEFTDFDRTQLDDWLFTNVIKNLQYGRGLFHRNYHSPYYTMEMRHPTDRIKRELDCWLSVSSNHDSDRIEFVGDCLAYDWVLLCELFDGAMHLPKNVSYIPIDICTMFVMKGIDPDCNREEFAGIEGKKHNALHDALVIKACYNKLTEHP